ncbi:GatB/YqeY domain-containing protein [Salinimicrobium tongyeongense]|uniref:GatB/YqeY domain-containing protein n=1 Tax=Salinimicrobium tongyeongense TaxID=2809707 RepID=A0ABY6NT55_9FLAO|nr:GatB/YqeY domain-containing protein [Salinimicrobium tongyeongense]UZH56092.1 GatB/YqeY domain-containing protein [Salinimicrobium tongyeongense]
MSLQDKVMAEMKEAMRAKDSNKLEALRAVKSAILLARTNASGKDGLSEDEELKLLQRLVKQRKESAAIYKEQGRDDLAQPELDQAAVIEGFLPEQMSEEEIEAEVDKIIAQTGASGMQDMGKVMGMASKELAGKADGKTISAIVKKKLAN